MGSGTSPDPSRTTELRPDGSGHGAHDQSPGPHGDHGGHGGHDEHEHEHKSRWPLIASIGAGGLYGGAALALFGTGVGIIPPIAGVALAVLGLIVLLAGLAGWINEAFIGPTHGGKSRESYVWTTLFFLTTDVSTFSGLFIYYFFLRVGNWPPHELPSLLGSLVLINTLLLVLSSITFHYAHEALHHGNRRRFLGLLGVTLGLGVIFLGGQVYEYYEFIVHEGFLLTTGVFSSVFYTLTGLHGLHVTLGVGGIAVVFWRALRGHYSPDSDISVTTVSLYWHFVDIVWIFLVIVIYVGSTL